MPKKPKILYIVTQDDLGGAARYVLMLARAYKDRAEVTITVGSDGDGWLTGEAAKLGIRTIVLKRLKRAISPFDDIATGHELRRLVRTGDWDIVHANSSKAGVIASFAAIGLTKPKIFYTAHGWVFLEPMNPIKKAAYFALEWIAARLRHGTIVLSERERMVARRELGIRIDGLKLIPHGLGPEAVERLMTRDGARTEIGETGHRGLLVGVVANLYKTKGLDILIEALSLPALAAIDFHLAIVGDGPELEKTEAATLVSPKKDSIRLVTGIGEAARIMPAFDLLVLPSRKEGLPFVLLEAMVAGVPIVATDVGGVRETVGDAGLVVAPEDPQALAEAIAKVLGDGNLRHGLAERSLARGRWVIERGEKMIDSTWDFYGLG